MANPFMTGPTEESLKRNNLPVFKEFAWDFDKNCFIMDSDGSHKIVEKNDAIKVWIMHALLVERYRYLAYFDDYGVELEHFIGKAPNDGQKSSELFRYVKEGLLVNPYIIDVIALSAKRKKKVITLTIKLETVYGTTDITIEV